MSKSKNIGWHLIGTENLIREYVLKGDWSDPCSECSQIERLGILDPEWQGLDLECLRCFPHIRELRVLSERVRDVAGIQSLSRLEALTIHRVLPKHLRVDFSRLVSLRRLSITWSEHLSDLDRLTRLQSLELRNVYGVKHLDLRAHRRLEQLDIGPAKGVERLSLNGLTGLKRLTLAVMPKLTTIAGDEFLHTINLLDISGSHAISPKVLASFTNLRQVVTGTRSKLTQADFPKCEPDIVRMPI